MNKQARILCALAGALLLAAGAASAKEPARGQELIWQDGKWVHQPAPAPGTPAGELAMIRQAMDAADYSRALGIADGFLKKYPAEPLREEVLGMAGDAELKRDRHWQAYERFEQQLTEFPKGARMERALEREIELARAFLSGKKRIAYGIFILPAQQEGIEILERVAERAPGTTLADTALLAIGDYHFDRQAWTESAEAYDSFLKLAPKSPKASYGELRAALSLWRSYRGPAYDETPLSEAEQRFKAFAQHYPEAAGEAGVDEIVKSIRAARAAKVMESANFYVRTGRPAAAGAFYRQISEQYGDTNLAERARALLAQPEKDRRTEPVLTVKPTPPPSARPMPVPSGTPVRGPAETGPHPRTGAFAGTSAPASEPAERAAPLSPTGPSAAPSTRGAEDSKP